MVFLRRSLLIVLIACHAGWAPSHAQGDVSYRGRSLESVIEELRAAGLPLVYSSNLVPSTLTVEEEPTESDPLKMVRELLRPHGLTISESNGAWLVVRAAAPAPGGIGVSIVSAASAAPIGAGIAQVDAPAGPVVNVVGGRGELGGLAPGRHVLTVRAAGYLPERVSVNVVAGEVATVTVALIDAVPRLEELTVTASRYDLINVQPSGAYFSREEIESLNELGDDTLRITHRLPGVASTEFSSRSHVRGGAADEMTVILDGMELVEPFHLRDYQGVFSAVDQRIVSGIQVYSGGFPAAYGDALSGLTIIDQREPTELRHELGLSLLYASVLSSGTFRDGRADWLISVRRSNLDRLLNENLGEPSYRDTFVHVGTALGTKHTLSLNGIGFDDDVLLTPKDAADHREQGRSNTDNRQLWLKLDSDWSSTLSSRTLVYSSRFTAERHGSIDDVDEIIGVADDSRALDAHGVKQDWQWDRPDRQLLSWGFKAESLSGRYDYASSVELRGVLATLGPAAPDRLSSFAPAGESYAAYFSDRLRITDRVITDFGVRWDRQSYLPSAEDSQFSPRASLLYRLGARTDVRFSFGRFFQSEGLLDLQIEDGVLEFSPAQNASHSIVGLEHRFANDLALRVEAFRKWTRTVRPRYENLYDPFVLLPELRPGRVRVAPDRAEARGLELFLNGEQPIDWWFGYSLADTDDVLDGARVPRSWDQKHAASGGITWAAGTWTLSMAATYHSGWPVTTLSLETVTAPNGDQEVIAVAGERNRERLPSLRRLDFRASKTFAPRVGSVRFFAEFTNVTNRNNTCCVRYEPVTLPGGSARLDRIEREALPLIVNVGVLWEF